MVQTKTMVQLVAELEAAMVEHAEAELCERAASAKMTSARSRLNEVHKAIDDLYAETRRIAPWNTRWHSQAHPGVPVNS